MGRTKREVCRIWKRNLSATVHHFILFFLCLLELNRAIVHDLTAKNFYDSIADGKLWLLEFYAPWCGHCQKLSPILDELSEITGSKMMVGKVDATVETKLAKDFNVKGFPSIFFTREGNKALQSYEGARTLQAMLAFSEKMNGPALLEHPTVEIVQNLVNAQQKVVFVLGAPPGEVTSLRAKEVFTKAGNQLQHLEPSFIVIESPDALASLGLKSTASIAKLEANEKPYYYMGAYDVTAFTSWAKVNSVPLITELGQHNFRQVGELGPLMVVGVVDMTDKSTTTAFVQAIREVASTLERSVREQFVFGYIDGKKWERFVKQFNIKGNLPRMFVLDYETKSFYEDPEVNEVEEIETFLKDITKGKVPAHREGIASLPSRVWNKLADSYPYSLLFIFPVLLLLLALYLEKTQSKEDTEKDKED